MARVLRRLSVSDISSVDVGAGVGCKVVLRKRDGGAVVREAVAALNASVRSILGDGTVADKRAAVAKSVTQCREYLVGKGVDAAAAGAAIAEVIGKLGDGSGFRNEERDLSPAQARSLATGNEEDEMSGSDLCRCPKCGYVGDEDSFEEVDDGDDGEMGKRLDLGTVRKAALMTHDSIVADFRKRMPSATPAEVLKAAVDSPEYMKLFRDERDAALRSGGHL
jgi:hypothetical protein